LSDTTLTRRVRLVAVALTLLLILLICAWTVARELSLPRVVLAALATAPLWLCLAKVRAGHRRTYALLTLVLVPYLVLALMEAIANPAARGWAGAMLLATFALFVCLIAYLRVSRAPPSLPERTAP
jgi:uncharacterized membrane protein